MKKNKSRIQLIIPMSGQGTRYQAAGYLEPKPLIPVNGEPMISRLMAVMRPEWSTTFVMADNHKETELPLFLAKEFPLAKQFFVPRHSEGPSRAIEEALLYIDLESPVLVSYCDYSMVWDPVGFENFVSQSECDACLVSYKGFHAHYVNPQTYAYSRMEGELVKEVKEKGSFTNDREQEWASCGAYYFKSGQILKDALSYQKQQNLSVNGEYYTSLTVQALLKQNPSAHVRVFETPYFFQWGTPRDLQDFEFWERSFKNHSKFLGHSPGGCDQLLVPMAGQGSRFNALTSVPKPFISVAGTPMFRRASDALPRAKKKIFVSLKDAESFVSKNKREGEAWVSLDKTPSGQALSTLAGVEHLDPDKDVLVTACDHFPVFDPKKWELFEDQKSKIDALIFTQANFQPANRNSNAYAYVELEKSGELFPKVLKVSVKKPLTLRPSDTPVLVGSFWFKNSKVLKKGIESLISKDIRVNGELYLDSVFEILMTEGFRVHSFPLDGYLCWGTPELLAQALYWEEVFLGRRRQLRPRFEEWDLS